MDKAGQKKPVKKAPAKKKPTGRPTKLTPALLVKAAKYAKTTDDAIPSIAGLSLYIGVARSTCHKWEGENSGFSDIVSDLMAMQEQKLLNNGLSGDFNASISKLILTKHGYTDKVETDNHTTIDLSGYSDAQLEVMAND